MYRTAEHVDPKMPTFGHEAIAPAERRRNPDPYTPQLHRFPPPASGACLAVDGWYVCRESQPPIFGDAKQWNLLTLIQA